MSGSSEASFPSRTTARSRAAAASQRIGVQATGPCSPSRRPKANRWPGTWPGSRVDRAHRFMRLGLQPMTPIASPSISSTAAQSSTRPTAHVGTSNRPRTLSLTRKRRLKTNAFGYPLPRSTQKVDCGLPFPDPTETGPPYRHWIAERGPTTNSPQLRVSISTHQFVWLSTRAEPAGPLPIDPATRSFPNPTESSSATTARTGNYRGGSGTACGNAASACSGEICANAARALH